MAHLLCSAARESATWVDPRRVLGTAPVQLGRNRAAKLLDRRLDTSEQAGEAPRPVSRRFRAASTATAAAAVTVGCIGAVVVVVVARTAAGCVLVVTGPLVILVRIGVVMDGPTLRDLVRQDPGQRFQPTAEVEGRWSASAGWGRSRGGRAAAAAATTNGGWVHNYSSPPESGHAWRRERTAVEPSGTKMPSSSKKARKSSGRGTSCERKACAAKRGYHSWYWHRSTATASGGAPAAAALMSSCGGGIAGVGRPGMLGLAAPREGEACRG